MRRTEKTLNNVVITPCGSDESRLLRVSTSDVQKYRIATAHAPCDATVYVTYASAEGEARRARHRLIWKQRSRGFMERWICWARTDWEKRVMDIGEGRL